MAGQAPEQGGSGEVQYPYSREYIEVVIEEEGSLELSLGSLATMGGSETYAAEEARLINQTDRILSAVGIEPEDWVRYVEIVKCDNTSDVSGKRLQVTPLEGERVTAGGYLHSAGFWDMPMESENSGEGVASIILRVDDTLVMHLIAEGRYYRDRFYKHSVSGEIVTEREKFLGQNPFGAQVAEQSDQEETDSIWGYGVEPEYLGYEDHHIINFKAVVRPAEAQAVAA